MTHFPNERSKSARGMLGESQSTRYTGQNEPEVFWVMQGARSTRLNAADGTNNASKYFNSMLDSPRTLHRYLSGKVEADDDR